MGQAAGTAAAYAVAHDVAPIELTDRPEAVWSVQQQLIRDDAFVIGIYNEDPRDLARLATATATSENGSFGAAANVLSGQSRAVVTGPLPHGKCGGISPTQGKPGSNRWMSAGLPAALTLQLEAPAALAQAEIVFVSSSHRCLRFFRLN